MITINTKKLKELRPCTERFKNWLVNYSEFSGTFTEFLDLPKVNYYDKIWVIKNVLSRDVLEQWAIICAESVLHIFESKHPDDKRLRECLEYLKSGEVDSEKLFKHRKNCYSAAAYAADAAAYAADAAAYAAADAADAAADAAYAAADAAYAAADADARQKQSEILRKALTTGIVERTK